MIRSGKAVFRILKSFIFPWHVRKGPFSRHKMIQKFRLLPLRKDYVEFKTIKRRFLNQYKFTKTRQVSERQLARILDNGLPLRLEYCYAAAAQYGLEYRYPLLDVGLIETVLAFPPWIKLHHGIKRYAFRQAIQGFVPEKIRLRNDKSGRTIPQMIPFMRTEQENIRKIIRSAQDTFLKDIIDFAAMEKWFEAVLTEDRENYKYLNLQLFFNYLMMLYYYGYCNNE
jgi:asparagine synthetase B (glutamine-hydrolysing)